MGTGSPATLLLIRRGWAVSSSSRDSSTVRLTVVVPDILGRFSRGPPFAPLAECPEVVAGPLCVMLRCDVVLRVPTAPLDGETRFLTSSAFVPAPRPLRSPVWGPPPHTAPCASRLAPCSRKGSPLRHLHSCLRAEPVCQSGLWFPPLLPTLSQRE